MIPSSTSPRDYPGLIYRRWESWAHTLEFCNTFQQGRYFTPAFELAAKRGFSPHWHGLLCSFFITGLQALAGPSTSAVCGSGPQVFTSLKCHPSCDLFPCFGSVCASERVECGPDLSPQPPQASLVPLLWLSPLDSPACTARRGQDPGSHREESRIVVKDLENAETLERQIMWPNCHCCQ